MLSFVGTPHGPVAYNVANLDGLSKFHLVRCLVHNTWWLIAAVSQLELAELFQIVAVSTRIVCFSFFADWLHKAC